VEAGAPKSWEEAKRLAERLLELFKPKHPRVKLFIGFEVKPVVWLDCPHFKDPEEALEEAKKYGKKLS